MFAMLARIESRCGPSFGRSQTTVASMWEMAPPRSRTFAAAAARKIREAAPRHCGSLGGKWLPISPSAKAPSKASVIA